MSIFSYCNLLVISIAAANLVDMKIRMKKSPPNMPPDESYCSSPSQYVENLNPEKLDSQDLSYCILSTSAEKERADR